MAGQDEMPMDAGAARGWHFVNALRVSLSLSEIRFELAQQGPREPGSPVWQFATTADHLLAIHQGFAVAVDSYQARYGGIGAVPLDPDMVRFADGGNGG